jgi:hypothetical protein
LNDDPFGVLSPNDLLCPVAVFLALWGYHALRHHDDPEQWQGRVLLVTLAAFAVNLVTI